MTKPILYVLDLESTLTPEIWVTVSQKSGVQDLRVTTRDIPDYNALMRMRIEICRKNNLTLTHIQEIIKTIEPLPGAIDFLSHLKSQGPVIILSDTFYQFATPLIEKFGFPALFCHSLSTDKEGFIADFHLRKDGGKREAVAALKGLGFYVVAIGDSHNDTAMLFEADKGFFIHAPETIAKEFPQFPSFTSYQELTGLIEKLAFENAQA